MIGKPTILGVPTEEWDGLPWRQDCGLGYLVFQPGLLEYVSDQASSSSPCMGWWGLITSSVFQHYSHLNTIVPSVLEVGEQSHHCSEYTNLSDGDWLDLPISPKSKGHLGGSIWVWMHLFHRSDLFYRVLYHITFPPILQWWKGEGAFLWVCIPFVCGLTFPHAMAEMSLMH